MYDITPNVNNYNHKNSAIGIIKFKICSLAAAIGLWDIISNITFYWIWLTGEYIKSQN